MQGVLVLGVVAAVVIRSGVNESARAANDIALTSQDSVDALQTAKRAVTSASKLFNGAFSQQYGLLSKINVKRGDTVKVGDILAELDSSVEQAQYDYYMLQADVALQVAAAQKEFDLATVKYQRAKSIFEKGGGNRFEVEEAEADAGVKRITIDIRKREGDVALAQARSQQARIDQMKIKSPVTGVVSEIHFKEGEIVDQNRAVIQVAQLDPLYIEMKDVHHTIVSALRVGQTLEVRPFGSTDDTAWTPAIINFISPLVDAATGGRIIRLEIPNPTLQPAGLEVEVKFPPVVARQAMR